jgi:predicted 3-demethylubiquinone-9 3-methyltransferase (glyoxalase superfamily)
MTQKITPFLWFDNQAEEAVELYTSIFRNSRITSVARYGEGAPRPQGTVMTIAFELSGQEFVALNGGPYAAFSPAISFFVSCETQEEVDLYWDKLLEGGRPEQCGWLRDRFGVTWQIVPAVLPELLQDPDPEKAQRVTQAMLGMVKLDIAGLRLAYEQG